MIAKLTGQIVYRGDGFVVVECGGIGYKVTLPDEVARGQGGTVSFFTHEAIRDDQRELFGFLSADALELFWRLTSVSGVGPRSGQKIVFSAPVARVKESIMKGDVAFLTAVPGIGTKTAQKIVLELKGELADDPAALSVDADALAALESLGYPRKQAEDVLAMIDAATSEERVTKALRMMGK
jgi:Holliday junction DNA helicase RuvA